MRWPLLLVLIFLLIPLAIATQVEITEIMYHPTQKDSFNEWIEVYSSNGVNLENYTLCGKSLLAGYITSDGTIHNNDSLTLPAGQYAIITDGGSGTDVYDNFQVDSNALSLSVDASTLCGALTNSGKTISIEFDNHTEVSVTYTSDWGADGDGNSLQFYNNTWQGCLPTPGADNFCPKEIVNTSENSTLQNTSNSTQEPVIEDGLVEGTHNISEQNESEYDEDVDANQDVEENITPEPTLQESEVQQNSTASLNLDELSSPSVSKSTKEIVYSKNSGNIKVGAFLLLLVSVMLNLILIIFR